MRRTRSGRSLAARLLGRGPETLETRLGRALGLSGRRLRCVPTHAAHAAPGCAVLAAWTDSATEPKARAFLDSGSEATSARAALSILCLPVPCRIVEEAPLGADDPRLDGVGRLFYIVTQPTPPRRRGPRASDPTPLPAQPILALRGHAPGSQDLDAAGAAGAARADSMKSVGTESASAARAPERLRIEDPARPGALSCILPFEFSPARGVDARILPRALRVPNPAAPPVDLSRFRCSLRLGSRRLGWDLGFPALPPGDPASAAMAARFAAIAAAACEKTATLLASLRLDAGEVRVEALQGAAAPGGALLVEAELRLASRDLPLLVALDAATLDFLARLAGLKPGEGRASGDQPDDTPTAEARLLRFLEANRRLRARLAPLALKAFAARPGLGYLLALLDAGDRSRLVSRLVASRRPAELLSALYVRGARPGTALPRAFFRDRDLLEAAPELWAEDFRQALKTRASGAMEEEVRCAAKDLALLDFLQRELRVGRLDLSAQATALLEPMRARSRAEGEKALLALAAKDGLWTLIGGCGRRLGASALAAVSDRALALASVTEIERRADLAPLMSRGRRQAFAEEAAWVDARYASGELESEVCLEARRLALARFRARLQALRRAEASERVRELSEGRARSGRGAPRPGGAEDLPRPGRS